MYEAQYSAVSYELYNLAWDMNIDWHEVTIGETYRNVMTEGMPDPRITVVDNGVVDNSSGIAVWESDKYPAADSPVEVATWRASRPSCR